MKFVENFNLASLYLRACSGWVFESLFEKALKLADIGQCKTKRQIGCERDMVQFFVVLSEGLVFWTERDEDRAGTARCRWWRTGWLCMLERMSN